MKFNKVLTILFLFTAQMATSQITGKIQDTADNYPLEYATAALYNQLDKTLVTGVITNIDGVFVIENIKNGRYYLEASFVGYTTKTIQNIEISKGNRKVDLGTINLVLGNQLNEVEINAERSTVINKIDRQVFDSKNFQSSQGGSATDVIKNLPSVTVDGLGDISVRGSKGFSVLINGKPTQGDANAILAQLPANALEKVEIITAPSAKYDPEGKGGILNIITKKGAANGTFVQINVRGGFPSIEPYDTQVAAQRYGADATINTKTDKWNLSFGTSYQRNDKTGRREGELFIINEAEDKQSFLPSDGERSFDDINYNGRFTVDFTPNENDEFSLGFFAGKHTVDRLADITYYDNHAVSPIESNNRLYTFSYYNHNLRTRKGDFVLGSFDYGHTFNDKSKLSTSFLYEYTFLGGPTYNDNVDTPAYNEIYQQEYNTNDNPLHGLRYNFDYKWKPFSFGTIETGYQFRNLDHEGKFVYERDGVVVPEFSSNIELKRTIHSSYAQLTGDKDKWDYAAGVRLESMDRTYTEALVSEVSANEYNYDFVKLFPSASLQYSVNDATKIKAAYSKRVERTTTFKMNSFAEREHSEVFEQGDNRLLPEFIDLVELGITKEFNSKSSLYATAYYRHVDNAINRVNTLAYESNEAVIDSILNRVYSNVGKSKAIGLELGTQFKATKNWSNFIGANIYNYDINGAFIFRHRDGITRTYGVNSSSTIYSFNINSTYSFWKNATAQLTFNYLSDTNTAQGEDSRFYAPNLTLKKSFLDSRLTATLQWQNIDMGLLKSNEQSIATWRPGEFYTTTNYVYEVDMVTLNLTYTFNKVKNKSKFIESEFGKREF
ncbi:outer membrane receptor protein involved in Fe transport [Mariniflexile fucanivorans]|uniref:Outer membrane receptor protein involved in Fe transport n=1 Tax=Mariniflexile fucanivorans TaxID=264023 RepID=A0A4R1RMY0_9FLAO|nr:outer membrane beta-barrel protein [Mariniflexile fucanivorans]TCL67653.1 outer membrane receptor protein involved in Fe transport [Mariniflexile fucanivorans]